MSNKSRLQTNNTNLQALINKANALPDAGGGGTKMVNVTLSGSIDMFYLDADGNLQQGHSGTVAALEGIIIYGDYTTYILTESISAGSEPLAIYSRIGIMQILKFKADGGTALLKSDGGGAD